MEWNKDKVLEEIRKRFEDHKSLIYADIIKDNRGLVCASNKYFKSYRAAVEAAGIKPQYRHKYITKEAIIKEIQKQYQLLGHLKPSYLRREYPGLYVASIKKFGSWNKACEEARFTFEQTGQQLKTKWNKENIKQYILLLYSSGKNVNAASMQLLKNTLYVRAVRIFGSWDNALVHCNLDPKKIKKTRFWTKEKVIEEIHKRQEKGEAVNYCAVQNTYLLDYARKHYGNWNKALKAAGVKQKYIFLGEKILGMMLEKLLPENVFWLHAKPDWFYQTNRRMHVDFYCEELRLGFEFQGPHHYIPLRGIKSLTKQQINDHKKDQIFLDNKEVLIKIKYNELTIDNVSQKLLENGISHNKKYSRKIDIFAKRYMDKYAKKKFLKGD